MSRSLVHVVEIGPWADRNLWSGTDLYGKLRSHRERGILLPRKGGKPFRVKWCPSHMPRTCAELSGNRKQAWVAETTES